MTNDHSRKAESRTPANRPAGNWRPVRARADSGGNKSFLSFLTWVAQDELATRLASLVLISSACFAAVLILIYVVASNVGIWWVVGALGMGTVVLLIVRIWRRMHRLSTEARGPSTPLPELPQSTMAQQLGDIRRFFAAFGNLERELQSYYQSKYRRDPDSDPFVPLGAAIRLLEQEPALTSKDVEDIRSIVNIRNRLAHAVTPSPRHAEVRDAIRKADELTGLVQSAKR